jgi:5'-nucleotidase (lipoprotein e(P4) family)
MRRLLAPALALLTACATATAPPPPTPTPAAPPATAVTAPAVNPGHTILNATLWVQTAAEYRASAIGTYAAARRALDDALANPARAEAVEGANADPTQPPAVILDLDETVLDNTGFEARVIQAGKTYDSEIWKSWVSESAATLIPGAGEFLAYAKGRGVKVFYITNRDVEDEYDGTFANLGKLGVPLDEGSLLMRRNKVSDKGPRRRDVADRHRVLVVVGDDFNDFANVREATWQQRDEILRAKSAWWGTHWFMIPNPMYGSWEDAAIGKGGAPADRVERKVRALRP